MILKYFVEYIQEEMEENPDWADKEIEFCTIDGGGLLFLSIYDVENKILFDIGTEEDDEENTSMMMERGMR